MSQVAYRAGMTRGEAWPPPNPDRHRGSAPGLAVLTALVQCAGTALLTRDVHPFGYVLLVVSGIALVDRHGHPRAVLAFVAGVTVALCIVAGVPWQTGLGYPVGATLLAVGLAVGVASVAAIDAGHHLSALLVLVGLGGAGYAGGLPVGLCAAVAGAFGALEVVCAMGRLGARMMRDQRRLDEERDRRRSSEERLRIARELHDVLGHHLSLINVRAGVGLHLMTRRPEQVREALEAIRHTSAEALREVQSVLTVLYPEGEAAVRAPAPGLDRLADLTTDAGLDVHTVVTGERRPLPAEIDRAAYRIVQEALTNVRRHAGPDASATITLDHTPLRFVVSVEDDGDGGPAIGGESAIDGNGISGMRERAAALGGTLAAGPTGGGWRVRAEFPLRVSTVEGA